MIITTKTPRHKVKTKDIKDKIFFCVFVVNMFLLFFACSAPLREE